MAQGEDCRVDRGRNPRIFKQKDTFVFSIIRRLWAEAVKCMKYYHFSKNTCGFRVLAGYNTANLVGRYRWNNVNRHTAAAVFPLECLNRALLRYIQNPSYIAQLTGEHVDYYPPPSRGLCKHDLFTVIFSVLCLLLLSFCIFTFLPFWALSGLRRSYLWIRKFFFASIL